MAKIYLINAMSINYKRKKIDTLDLSKLRTFALQRHFAACQSETSFKKHCYKNEKVRHWEKIAAKAHPTKKLYLEYTKNSYNLIIELILSNYAQLRNGQKT